MKPLRPRGYRPGRTEPLSRMLPRFEGASCLGEFTSVEPARSPDSTVRHNTRGHRRLASWVRGVAVLLFSLLTTGALLNTEILPLGAVRAEDLAQDYGLLTWNFWAITESALRGETPYRTSLLFHPIGSNLATHTLGPGFLPLGLAARAARDGNLDYPLYAHRLSILFCFSLGVLLGFHALRALGSEALSALAASVGWAFAACWHPLVANPTLASACFLIPAVTLACSRFAREPSTARAVVLAMVVSSSVYFSEYFSAFVVLALAVLGVCAMTSAETRRAVLASLVRIGPRGLALASATGVLVALPFLTSWMGSEGRPPKERQLLAGGANLAGFVIPSPSSTPLYASEGTARLHARVTRGGAPFIGVPTALLSLVGLAVAPRRLRRLLVPLGLVFFVLSLGPVLKVLGANTGVPLPYALLRHVPPLHMAREPRRLAVFGVWALVCLAALGLTALVRAMSGRFRPGAGPALALVALAWWAAEGYRPGLQPLVFTPPAELLRIPPGAVANVPLSISDGLAMFLQIYHGRPIVTGYVSRASERQVAHVLRLQQLLDRDPRLLAQALRSIGVDTLILQPGTPEGVAASLGQLGFNVLDLRAGLPLASALSPAGGDVAVAPGPGPVVDAHADGEKKDERQGQPAEGPVGPGPRS